MKHPTVAQMWAKFHAIVVPKEASKAQVDDTQEAFYAGAASMLGALRELAEDEEIEGEEGAMVMCALEHEVKTYAVQMAAQAMASSIVRATGAEVHVNVHDLTKPAAGEVH
ncbi:MAG TPA: hypothetical protein VFM98_03410 [Ramlibacter sp.]|uniref:hypothetical protein n=1 Tax=Ramlibacter sp. TaxID=1917967 RepID=UPI002D809995|nr:hypothetical protein [Ramlibacter sp.]HET8744627.1 hypothetical protein [Ramlibacter sp.]